MRVVRQESIFGTGTTKTRKCRRMENTQRRKKVDRLVQIMYISGCVFLNGEANDDDEERPFVIMRGVLSVWRGRRRGKKNRSLQDAGGQEMGEQENENEILGDAKVGSMRGRVVYAVGWR